MATFGIKAVISASTQQFKSAVGGLSGFLKSSVAGISGIFAGIFAGGTLKSIISEFARLQDLSEQLRLPASELFKLSQAAKLGGADVEVLTKALQKSEREAVKAAAGGKKQADAFAALGISARDFLDLDATGKTIAIAKAYEQTTDKSKALAASQVLLGKASAELVPLLRQGEDGVRSLIESGAELSDQQIQQLADLDDKLEIFLVRLKTFGAQVITAIEPIFNAIVEIFTTGFITTINNVEALFTGKFSQIVDNAKNAVILMEESIAKAFNGEDVEPSTAAVDEAAARLQAAKEAFDTARNGSPTAESDALKEEITDIEEINELYRESIRLKNEAIAIRENPASTTNDIAIAEEILKRAQALKDAFEGNLAKAQEREGERDAVFEEAKQAQQIAALKAQGLEEEAKALASKLDIEKQIADLRKSGTIETDEQAEKLRGILTETARLQNTVTPEATEIDTRRASPVFEAFRSIGGAANGLSVAINGPLDKLVSEEQKTRKVIELQTKQIVDAVNGISIDIGTAEFN